MTKVNKEEEIYKAKDEKNRAAFERKNIIRVEDEEESSLSSSISMYNLDSNREDS